MSVNSLSLWSVLDKNSLFSSVGLGFLHDIVPPPFYTDALELSNSSDSSLFNDINIIIFLRSIYNKIVVG